MRRVYSAACHGMAAHSFNQCVSFTPCSQRDVYTNGRRLRRRPSLCETRLTSQTSQAPRWADGRETAAEHQSISLPWLPEGGRRAGTQLTMHGPLPKACVCPLRRISPPSCLLHTGLTPGPAAPRPALHHESR